jgi:hypothetical protein
LSFKIPTDKKEKNVGKIMQTVLLHKERGIMKIKKKKNRGDKG